MLNMEKQTNKIKCYGCDKEVNISDTKRMRVVHERKKQRFCKECYDRLVKIKLGGL